MTPYGPNSCNWREVLVFFFNKNISVAETHGMLSNTDGEVAINERTFF